MSTGRRERMFGMALGRIGMPAGDIPDYLNFPHLQALELSPGVLLSPGFADPRQDIFRHIRELHAGPLMERSVTDAVILYGDFRRRMEFAEEAVRILNTLAALGIRKIALDCTLSDIPRDEEGQEPFRQLLRLLAPALLRNGQTLLLPYRIPSEMPPQAMTELLRNTLLPCIKARLEIHPCEMKMPVDTTCAGQLRRETESFCFLFDADCGAHIVRNHILPWLKWMEDADRAVPFFLAPVSQRQRMTYPEAEAWERLAAEFLNE